MPKKLEKGKVYNFQKPEERIYPLYIPIGLCDYKNPDKFLAKVEVLEFKVSKSNTKGKFKIIEIL